MLTFNLWVICLVFLLRGPDQQHRERVDEVVHAVRGQLDEVRVEGFSSDRGGDRGGKKIKYRERIRKIKTIEFFFYD